MANLRPVREIVAVKERHPGEVFEARANEVVVAAHPAHARIGMETGHDWVSVSLRRRHRRAEATLTTAHALFRVFGEYDPLSRRAFAEQRPRMVRGASRRVRKRSHRAGEGIRRSARATAPRARSENPGDPEGA